MAVASIDSSDSPEREKERERELIEVVCEEYKRKLDDIFAIVKFKYTEKYVDF